MITVCLFHTVLSALAAHERGKHKNADNDQNDRDEHEGVVHGMSKSLFLNFMQILAHLGVQNFIFFVNKLFEFRKRNFIATETGILKLQCKKVIEITKDSIKNENFIGKIEFFL